jgi:hypothetical protein
MLPVKPLEPPPPAVRAKVPPPEALARAEKAIKDLFREEYALQKPADRLALAAKLHQQSRDPTEEAAVRFVLLREAAFLAAQAGNLAQTLEIVGELVKAFEVAPAAIIVAALEKIDLSVLIGDDCRILAEESLAAVSEALTADDFDSAARLLKLGENAARKAQNASLVTTISTRKTDVERIRAEFETVKGALATLAKTPADPDASLTVGKYHCFAKGAWERGLPLLAQSSDPRLKPLAAQDLAAPASAAQQRELADAWYDLATSLTPVTAKIEAQLRAGHWYAMALPGSSGLARVHVEKRLAELETVSGKAGGGGELFAAIAAAVRKKEAQRTKLVGFTLAKEFEEVPAEGALLIGFEVGLEKRIQSDVVSSLRPIYRTARGERMGAVIGKPVSRNVTVKAKAGYAVAGVTLQVGVWIDGLSLTCMKVDGRGFKVTDAYQSEWVGGKQAGREASTSSGGALVVGVCGQTNATNQNKPCALGLVTLPAREKE